MKHKLFKDNVYNIFMKEEVKKNSDWNNTMLQKKIVEITDDNFNFLDNYTIKWEIIKQ